MQTNPEDIPSFPMPRECPFHPPAPLTELRRHDPVSKVRIFDGSEHWIVTSYAECRQLLRDPRLSSNFYLPGFPHHVPGIKALRETPSFATLDPPEHSKHRQMFTSDFSLERVEQLRPTIERMVDDHLDEMESHGAPVDLMQALLYPIPSLAVAALMGVPSGDHEYFNAAASQILARTSTLEQSQEASKGLKQYLAGLITERTERPQDDLLSRLGQQISAGTLSEEEALSDALLILVAGHDTTANQMGLGVLTLLENPEQFALIRQGTVELTVAIEEILRFITVVQFGRRRIAVDDIEIAGKTIRKGDGVIVMTETANRDETMFDQPDTFMVDRNPNRHMAFGFGVHQCLGQRVARTEMEIVLQKLFDRFPNLHLARGVDELEFNWNEMFYGAREIPVAW